MWKRTSRVVDSISVIIQCIDSYQILIKRTLIPVIMCVSYRFKPFNLNHNLFTIELNRPNVIKLSQPIVTPDLVFVLFWERSNMYHTVERNRVKYSLSLLDCLKIQIVFIVIYFDFIEFLLNILFSSINSPKITSQTT